MWFIQRLPEHTSHCHPFVVLEKNSFKAVIELIWIIFGFKINLFKFRPLCTKHHLQLFRDGSKRHQTSHTRPASSRIDTTLDATCAAMWASSYRSVLNAPQHHSFHLHRPPKLAKDESSMEIIHSWKHFKSFDPSTWHCARDPSRSLSDLPAIYWSSSEGPLSP